MNSLDPAYTGNAFQTKQIAMLIALFIALATAFFGGNSNSPFVIPKVEKLVRQEIKDKGRKAEMQAMMKDYKKEWKALEKKKKKQAKVLSKLNKDRDVEEQEMAAFAEEASAQRQALQQKLIDGRCKAQELITLEEWGNIMDRVSEEKLKKEKKLEKAQAKTLLKQNKAIAAVGNKITAAFEDPVKREEARAAYERFNDDLSNLLVASQEYPNKAFETMRNGQASREELASVVKELEMIRQQATRSFLELRAELRGLSTEKNWPKLAKALGKFI